MKPFFILTRPARQDTWRRILEDPRVLKSLYLKVVLALLDGLTKEWCIATHLFAVACVRLARLSGPLHLALYLKSCRVALMKQVAGDKTPLSLSPAVSLTRSGLPRIIPSFHRKKIKDGDAVVIQMYLSFLSLSKIIPLAAKVSKDTFASIMDSFDKEDVESVNKVMRTHLPSLIERYVPSIRTVPLHQGLEWMPTWKSVPSHSVVTKEMKRRKYKSKDKRIDCSPSIFVSFSEELNTALILDLFYASQAGHHVFSLQYDYTRFAFDELNDSISKWGQDAIESKLKDIPCSPRVLIDHRDCKDPFNPGVLSCSLSGDGKRRLFAIGNYVVQRLLRPVHDYLMAVLRTIPMDGTFHQTRPLDRLSGVPGIVHSIDLKSATDRWPLPLLSDLLETLFDKRFSQMVSDGCLGNATFVPTFTKSKWPVIFATGQPLGFYPSWPLFALSHHTVVWRCAESVYPGKKFSAYALLGDDLVIADDKVALSYKRLIAALGVEVSPSKTIVSKTGACEFAKKFRICRMTQDVSPLSLKAINGEFYPLLNLLCGRSLRDSTLMRIAGFGHKVASRPLGSPKHKLRSKQAAVLLRHSRLAKYGVSLSLSYILGKAVPAEVMGMLYNKLINFFEPTKQPDLPSVESFLDPEDSEKNEYTIYQGWMKSYLNYLRWYCMLRIAPVYTLDVFFDAPLYESDWRRTGRPAELAEKRQYGLSLRIYNWAAKYMAKPVRVLPAQAGTVPVQGRHFVIFLSSADYGVNQAKNLKK